jgi:epoxide hydrolase 4
MQSQLTQTNNVKPHVVTGGPENGTAVILLHGFPELLYGWKNQPTLDAARRQFGGQPKAG